MEAGARLPQERYEFVLSEVRRRRAVRVTDLAGQLDVSEVTVRRDIAHLAELGLVRRVHGGATVPSASGGVREAEPAPDEATVLGMMVPSSTYYYPDVIRGAQSGAAAAGVRLMMHVSRYDPAEERRQVRALVERGAQGLLLTPDPRVVDDPEFTAWLRGFDVPFVLVERRLARLTDAAEVESVSSDHAAGAARAVGYLASLGHHSVGLFTVNTPTAVGIAAGYAEAVRSLGLSPDAPLVRMDRMADPAGTTDLFGDLLRRCADTNTTALLVHGDQDAALLAQTARQRGVRVPDDLAIVAYDDEIAALVGPPLTAVAPPKAQLGRIAIELLLNRLRNPQTPVQHISLVPRLIIRSSCGGRSDQARPVLTESDRIG